MSKILSLCLLVVFSLQLKGQTSTVYTERGIVSTVLGTNDTYIYTGGSKLERATFNTIWGNIPLVVQDEGTSIVTKIPTAINFTGAGVTATVGSNVVTVNIPGGGSAITLTTTGTSGAATLVGSTLNIPNYATSGGSGIVTDPAIAGTGTVALTFDQIRYFQKTTQTGNITLSLAASGHLNGRTQVIDIDGNSTNSLTFPSTWDNGNGVIFDNTKNNQIYLDYVNGRVTYNIKKGTISAVDVTAPVATFSPVNGATNSSISSNITISLSETIYTTTGTLIDNSNVASVVQLKLTNTSGSTVASSVSISGTTITIDPTSNLSNSTVYYVALLPVEDLTANESALQTATFTTAAAGDVIAPTLSSPTASATGTSTATIGVTTNEANGPLYAVVTTSATAPTPTQVKAGQNNTGSAAAYSGNQAVTTIGAKTFSATGLTASTVYYSYFMHEDASGNQSTVTAASSFTTAALVFHNSTFTGTGIPLSSYVPGTGNVWTAGTGTFNLLNDAIVTNTYVNTIADAFTELGTGVTNYTANIVAKKTESSSVLRIYLRYTDANNFVYVGLGTFGNTNAIEVSNIVGGVGTAFGTWTGTIPLDVNTTFQFILSGTSLSINVNGVSRGSGTIPTTQVGTKFGVGTGNNPGNMLYDSVNIVP